MIPKRIRASSKKFRVVKNISIKPTFPNDSILQDKPTVTMKREDVRRQSMFWLNLHCFSNMISFLFFWKRLLPNYFIPIFNFIQKARIYHVRHNHLWSYAHSSPTPLRLHPERNSRIDRHLTFIVLSSGSGLPKANDGIFY